MNASIILKSVLSSAEKLQKMTTLHFLLSLSLFLSFHILNIRSKRGRIFALCFAFAFCLFVLVIYNLI